MPQSGITRVLLKSLKSWRASDTVLMWVWALCFAGAVTLYEIYFNNESQHPSGKFWTELVPGYFTIPLVFTGVTLGLSTLAPPLKGWLGILVTSVAVSILFALFVPGSADWLDRVRLGRNVVVLSTLYLVPPYLIATLLRWSGRVAD